MEFITSGWFPPSRGGSASRSGRRAGTSGSAPGMARRGRGRGRAVSAAPSHGRSRGTNAVVLVANSGSASRRSRRWRATSAAAEAAAAATAAAAAAAACGGLIGASGGGCSASGPRRRGCWPGVPAAPGRAGLARLGVGWSPTPAKPRAGSSAASRRWRGAWCGRNEEGGGGRGSAGDRRRPRRNAREAFETHGGVFRAEPEVIAREFPLPRRGRRGVPGGVDVVHIAREGV